jgi:uncharacterized SAM-binding protein YcdF (DUF218 family)
MVIKVASIVAVGVLTIALIGAYLSPDDLRTCQASPSTDAACKKADAIVAISGGDTTARTEEAIRLFKNGWADTLIFSGAAADKSGPSNAEVMKKIAIAQGVPAKDIMIEDLSQTTYENAQRIQTVLREQDLSRMILVTSAYHQRRASIEFRRAVGSGATIINHPVARDNQWSMWWWLTPTGWFLALGELVKILLVYLGVAQ